MSGRSERVIDTIFGNSGSEDIVQVYATMYDKTNMDQRISSSISKHMDDAGGATEEIEELVADISTEIFNKFILSIGYDYYSENDIEELRLFNEKNKLGLHFPEREKKDAPISSQKLSKIMEITDDLDQQRILFQGKGDVNFIPGMVARSQWRDQIRIAMVGAATIPDYDVQANRKLGEIIAKICQ